MVSQLQAMKAWMETCRDAFTSITDSSSGGASGGISGYQLQPIAGYCVRSTDNEYDFDNLTELLLDGTAQECADACDNL